MLAVEIPEQLVVPVLKRHVAGVPIARSIQAQRAGGDDSAVAGWWPGLDLPGHGLGGIEAEGVEVEDAHVRLIAPVGDRSGRPVDLDGPVIAARGFRRTRGLRVRRVCRGKDGQAGGGKCHTDNPGEFRPPAKVDHIILHYSEI